MMDLLMAGLLVALSPLCFAADKKLDGKKADEAEVSCGKAVFTGTKAKVSFRMRLGKNDKKFMGVSPVVIPEGKETDTIAPFVYLDAPKPGVETTKSYVTFPVKGGKEYELKVSIMYEDTAGEIRYAKGTVKFKVP
jgi:hypothetical protein